MNTKSTMRFDEDSFDLAAHKKAADAVTREKARVSRVRKQVRRGKIILAVVMVVIFFALFYIAAELDLMQIF
ncbi:MAG: hypothetical protein FWB96_11340 [Defluviitaleaceae bacterium]|nr:hypothetical protein [Defluviitaleaceae bacterium]MCL2263626.1 hypothetical protein [Defluviitaleaceae bacterium]